MLQPHLKSKVGRRLFSRFLIAALLPIGGLAWYAYDHVGQILLENAQHRLTIDSKAYGMSLVESLQRHANALQLTIEQGEMNSPAATRGFTQLRRIVPVEPDSREGNAMRLRLSAGMAPELIAVVPGDDLLLAGEIAADPFWNNDFAPERFCVFSTAREVLYCSPGIPAMDGSVIPAGSRDQNSEVSEQRLDDVDYLLGFWHARYLPSFGSPGFVVMVATPKDVALQDLTRFRMAFPAVLVLTIALAVGLSNSQIRRQMEPLIRLEESTRQLSAGVLDTRANISTNDEFGQLGRAFDRMASHLEQEFHMLGLLSELDRAILGSLERTVVVDTLLRRIHLAIPCDRAAVIVVNEAGAGSLTSGIPSAAVVEIAAPVLVAAGDLPVCTPGESWCRLPPDDLPASCKQAFAGLSDPELLAFPAHLDGRLDSVLLLAFASPPDRLDEIVRAGRSLADRLTIAASSIAHEQMLYQQAHYDALTDLPNRILLRDRIDQAITRADREQSSIALLFIDLDRFKQVNDSLGHSKGDSLLVEYAHRLRRRIRSSDTVARLGGDEFVVLIPDLAPDTAYATVDGIAGDLNEMLATPFQLNDQPVVAPASIGIALYPDNASNQEELLKMADAAMYESKRRNSGGYCFYTSNISALTRARFELTQELRGAVERQELLLFFQPKVDAHNGTLCGAEALLRWNSPKRGMVLPGLFLNLLDEMGLSTWLGDWVLKQACAQMRAWDRRGFQSFPLSINFSPLQFERTPVVDRIRSALEEHNLDSGRLEVEILESIAANESPNVRQSLILLRELGVRIALDDFGTGFSSLVHLTEVPADIVKLDRIFIQNLCTEARQRRIVELIIAMAKVMDLTVVAEGVEHEDQRELLPKLGCDVLQGYLIGHPAPPDEFATRWLSAPNATSA